MKISFTKFFDWLSTRSKKDYLILFSIIIIIPTIYFLSQDSKILQYKNEKDLEVTNEIEKDFLPKIDQDLNKKLRKLKISPFNQSIQIQKEKEIKKIIVKQEKRNTGAKNIKYVNSTVSKKKDDINLDILEAIQSTGQTENINYEYVLNNNDNNQKEKLDNWQDKFKTNNTNTYPLKADRIIAKGNFIRIILNSAVNTEIAGIANILVDEDVYSQSKNYILIPKGSTGIIEYENTQIKLGSTRLSFQLTRIVTPLNIIISFENTIISDLQGATGIAGKVDNKILEKYGIPLLFNVINTGLQIASYSIVDSLLPTNTNQNNLELNENLKNTFATSNAQALEELLKTFINLQPIIKLDIGTTMTITPFLDIYLKEPENNVIYPTIENIF